MSIVCADRPDYTWYQFLPKIELHAHLSGSISKSTLLRLIHNQAKQYEHNDIEQYNSILSDINHHTFTASQYSLSDCFIIFQLLHKYVDTLDILYYCTQQVIQDFHNDNVIYLELRTTPRIFYNKNKQPINTKQQYIDTVIHAINEYQQSNETNRLITVRLLLSIDRTQSLADAIENVELAHCYMTQFNNIVVGIDFSGNPTRNQFIDYIDAFQLADKYSIPCSIHCGEIDNYCDTESILQYSNTSRIGHGVCMNNSQFNYVYQHQIPIEICTTSNIMTCCCTHIQQHPVYELIRRESPYIICTDDCGVFNSTLTNEYYNVYQLTELNKLQIIELTEQAINYIFDKDIKLRQQLKESYSQFKILHESSSSTASNHP